MPTLEPAVDETLRDEIFVTRFGDNPHRPARNIEAFFEEVYRFCVRCVDGRSDAAKIVVFVLSERIEVDDVFDAAAASFSHIGRLDKDCPATLPASIVVTTANLRLAFSELASKADLPTIVTRLSALGLDTRPATIYLSESRSLFMYADGVKQGTSDRADARATRALDPGDLDAVLTYFHENWTRYPDGLGNCWHHAGERVLQKDAERNVQNALFVFLGRVVYRSRFVVREHMLPNGYIDIYVFEQARPSGGDVVLELKVLRSRSIGWSPGKQKTYSENHNLRYVQRGLRQARRYLDSTDAEKAYLLCYDGRLMDADIPIHDYAAELSIDYRRYFMESSVKEA